MKLNGKIIRVISFILIFCVLFFGIQEIVMQKNIFNEKTYYAVKGFYDEPENSIDVLFLGSSHVYCNINPLILFEEYGITSYELATAVQRVENSYFFLKEFLKQQNPEVIFFECYGMSFENEFQQNWTHSVYDYVPFSLNKIRGIKEALVINTSADEGMANYLLPMLNYHTRWKSLSEKDFTLPKSEKRHTYKGYAPYYEVTEVTVDEEKYNDPNVARFSERNIEYLNKIIALCKEENIELVLFKTPSPAVWYQAYSDELEDIAKANEIVFLDLKKKDAEIGIDYAQDYMDEGKHLNIHGATKLSLYLAEYLNQHYDLANHKDEEAYYLWQQDLAAYYQEVEAKEATK